MNIILLVLLVIFMGWLDPYLFSLALRAGVEVPKWWWVTGSGLVMYLFGERK